MFNGMVTGLTLCAFTLMVGPLLTFPLREPADPCQVGSSVIAAWADISSAFKAPVLDQTTRLELDDVATSTIGGTNAGYLWMGMNCFASAAYVSFEIRKAPKSGRVIGMRLNGSTGRCSSCGNE